MYDEQVGKKMMVLAQVLGWINLAAGVIAWIYFLVNEVTVTAWICLLAGVLSFFFSWVLYGFGQMVDDVRDIYYATKHETE